MNHIEYLTISRNLEVEYISKQSFKFKFQCLQDLYIYLNSFCKMLLLENENFKHVSIHVPGFPIVTMNCLDLSNKFMQDDLCEIFECWINTLK